MKSVSNGLDVLMSACLHPSITKTVNLKLKLKLKLKRKRSETTTNSHRNQCERKKIRTSSDVTTPPSNPSPKNSLTLETRDILNLSPLSQQRQQQNCDKSETQTGHPVHYRLLKQQQQHQQTYIQHQQQQQQQQQQPGLVLQDCIKASSIMSPLKKTEQRRREQRRLSAQKRRERKRYTLADLEARVLQYQNMDMELRLQLSLAVDKSSLNKSETLISVSLGNSDASGAHDESSNGRDTAATECLKSLNIINPAVMVNNTKIKSQLDAVDQKKLYPKFPNWNNIIIAARDKATAEAKADLVQQALVPRAPRDKNTIRRERNRLSARMSRLRKRLRREYLETMWTLLSERVTLLRQVLNGKSDPCSKFEDSENMVDPSKT